MRTRQSSEVLTRVVENTLQKYAQEKGSPFRLSYAAIIALVDKRGPRPSIATVQRVVRELHEEGVLRINSTGPKRTLEYHWIGRDGKPAPQAAEKPQGGAQSPSEGPAWLERAREDYESVLLERDGALAERDQARAELEAVKARFRGLLAEFGAGELAAAS